MVKEDRYQQLSEIQYLLLDGTLMMLVILEILNQVLLGMLQVVAVVLHWLDQLDLVD